jgi:sodium/potassium-transporting ATPase subunit alpha
VSCQFGWANHYSHSDIASLDWHTIPTEDVLRRLSTSIKQGLSSDQVGRKLNEYGRNALTPPPSRWFRKTIGYLFGGFGSILLTASILVFVAWKPLGSPPAVANLALAIVLVFVWVIQAGFAFFQGKLYVNMPSEEYES